MKIVSQMLIFDVDGVITDPQEKKITQPQILDEIIKKLKRGEPVALNTGRSIEWVKDRVLKPLVEKVKGKKILQYLLAVGEKGGTWAEKENIDTSKYPFTIHQTQAKFEKGTLEFLQTL